MELNGRSNGRKHDYRCAAFNLIYVYTEVVYQWNRRRHRNERIGKYMKLKKIMAIGLICTMTASAFAGCGGAKKEETAKTEDGK